MFRHNFDLKKERRWLVLSICKAARTLHFEDLILSINCEFDSVRKAIVQSKDSNRPYRILIVMPYPDGQAGASRSVEIAASYLDPKVIDATVLTSSEGTLSRALEDCGTAQVMIDHDLPEALRAYPKKSANALEVPFYFFKNIVSYIRFAKRLAQLCKEKEMDAIVANCLHPKLVCYFASKIAKIPLIWHVRTIRKGANLRMLQTLGKRKNVAKIICISKPVARPFGKELESKITIVPNGVPLGTRTRTRSLIRKELGLSDEEILVGLVGRVVPYKGVGDFIDAAANTCSLSKKATFVVLGTTPRNERIDFMAKYKKRVEDLGLSNRIHFFGHRDNIDDLMPDLDVLVQPSRWEEPFGRTLIEGMAAGVCVVASNTGGMPEILGVEDQDDVSEELFWAPYGVVFPAQNVASLSAALKRLLENKELRGQLAAAGLKRVEQTYSALETTKTYERAIIEAISK